MKGRKDAKLVPVEGVVSMPKRWRIYDKDAKVKTKNLTFLILQQFQRACEKDDCSGLYYGASYSNLTFEGIHCMHLKFIIKEKANSRVHVINGFGKIEKIHRNIQMPLSSGNIINNVHLGARGDGKCIS